MSNVPLLNAEHSIRCTLLLLFVSPSDSYFALSLASEDLCCLLVLPISFPTFPSSNPHSAIFLALFWTASEAALAIPTFCITIKMKKIHLSHSSQVPPSFLPSLFSFFFPQNFLSVPCPSFIWCSSPCTSSTSCILFSFSSSFGSLHFYPLFSFGLLTLQGATLHPSFTPSFTALIPKRRGAGVVSLAVFCQGFRVLPLAVLFEGSRVFLRFFLFSLTWCGCLDTVDTG